MLFLVTPPRPSPQGEEVYCQSLERRLTAGKTERRGTVLPFKRNSLREYVLKSPHPVPPLKGRRCIAKVWSAALRRGEFATAPHVAYKESAMADGLSRHLYGDVITPVPPPPAPSRGGGCIAKVWSDALRRGKFATAPHVAYKESAMADGLSRHLCGDVITPIPPPPAPSPSGKGCAELRCSMPPDGGGNLQRHRASLIRSPPVADGLSRRLCGDVITPVPPPPAPSPSERGCAELRHRVPPYCRAVAHHHTLSRSHY